MVSVPVYWFIGTDAANNSPTKVVSCWPAVISIKRLPPGMGAPAALTRENVTLPPELAIRAIPVLVGAAPTESGKDTDLEVTVVAVFAFGEKAGWMYRASMATFPFENTFANPLLNVPLLCVLMVVEPEGGIKNVIFGSVIADGIIEPSLLKKSTIP